MQSKALSKLMIMVDAEARKRTPQLIVRHLVQTVIRRHIAKDIAREQGQGERLTEAAQRL